MITVDELLEREKEFRLYDKEINGFQFWQYERFYIYSNLRRSFEQNNKEPNMRSHRSLKKYLKYYVRNGRNFRIKKNVDICFVAHPRRVYCDGVYECAYTDAIAEKFPNSVTLERFYEMQHFEPIKSSNVIYQDRVIIHEKVYFLFMKKICRQYVENLKQQISTELQEALQGIATKEQIEIFTLHTVEDYFRYKYYCRYYQQLLRRINPKLVVEVVSYNIHCMVINEICKNLGITTIEFQHGNLNSQHIAYNYAQNHGIRQFPDKIYLYGNYYREDVRYPITRDKLVVVGFPYFEREVNKHRLIKKEEGRYTVVFLSQGRRWTPSLFQLALDLQQIMQGQNTRIIYKLHPSEYENWEQLYPELQGSGIEVIGAGNVTLYDCLAASDVQVGVYSTTILEGLGFGLRTFIYSQKEAESMQGLLDMGIAELVGTAQELADKIGQKHTTQPGYDINYFWRENSLNNMEQALRTELET